MKFDANKPAQFHRRKSVFVSFDQVMRILTGHKIFQRHVVIPFPKGLPDSAVVIGMHVVADRAGYLLTVCDPSFEVVEPGVQSPELEIEWTTVDIVRPEGKEKP